MNTMKRDYGLSTAIAHLFSGELQAIGGVYAGALGCDLT